jgi:hypothetical protein
MTHYSGLAADLDLASKWTGYNTALEMIISAWPLYSPGTHYAYSDINSKRSAKWFGACPGCPLRSIAPPIFLSLSE